MHASRYLLLALCCLLPVACTTTRPPALELPGEPADKLIYPAPQTSPAVVDLLNQARDATRQGELQRAEVLLERSVRIEPRNPTLWNYLAKLRLHQGRLQEAVGLAAKSNALAAASDDKLKADNWRIIAHARYQSGDVNGAKEAQRKADTYINK
ncbi:MAG: tetratricopeptide repeat protein [Gammaproteobacteria bacterium]|nr:tetratricopeptide repeat protein [Gammaproteobacteria bacterium]